MRKPKPKKRGRKPGVKVGPYKKRKTLKVTAVTGSIKKGDRITLDDYVENILKPMAAKYSPTPILTLCGQLEDSVMLLENRISNVIAKINSLM